MVHQHQIAAVIAVTVALAASLLPSASAAAAPLGPTEAAITVTHPAAAPGFNRGPDGKALAAELGFKHGTDGQATAAQLGFNRGSYGQATAAELGFNPSPVSQANPTASTAGSPSARANGFQWDDAGIGAAGAVGLLMLLLGGALVMTKSRQRPRSHTPQPTT